jgi:hypothetical protein
MAQRKKTTASRKTWVRVPKGPIPESIREALKRRLLRHVSRRWNDRISKVFIRFHGAYVYIAAQERQKGDSSAPKIIRYAEPNEIPVELCRLGYLGRSEEWDYAFYKYSDDRYAPSVLASGRFTATPEQCFDSSAGVYISGGPLLRWREREN